MTRAVAWSLAVVTTLCVVLDTMVVSAATTLWSTETFTMHGWPLVDVAGLGCAVLGALILMTYPRHLIGWLLVVVGLSTSVSLLAESYSVWVIDEGGPGSTRAGGVAAWIAIATGGPFALSVLALIFLVVPDGHLVSRRWRPVGWAAVAGCALSLAAVVMLSPDRVDTSADTTQGLSAGELLASVGILLTTAALVAAVISMVVRLRRSRGEARQQLRWVVSAAIFVALSLVAIIVEQSLFSGGQQTPLTSLSLFISYVCLIASIAISALRFRLWDLDIIISRAVALACATVFVTGAYVALVVVVGDRLNGDAESFGLSLAITAVVSLAFQPLRRWVVRLADRLAYGSRAQPYDALAEFSRRAGDSPAPDQLLPTVAEAAALAASALQATARLDLPDGTDESATWVPREAGREAPGSWVEIPVADESGTLGAIAVLLPAVRGLRHHEVRLLRDIADQAAVAFCNARLETDLAAHVAALDRQTAALAASRARLIQASDTARHRLEDSISREVLSRLRALRHDLADLPAGGSSPERIGRLVDEVTAVLESLRDLTKGLHPTLLTRGGLAAALASYVARSGGAATLEVDPSASTVRWPDQVEAAAYFCCTQAGSAEATDTMAVRLTVVDDVLELDLSGVDPEAGVRQAMIDRVEALGGTLHERDGGLSIRLPRSPEAFAVPAGGGPHLGESVRTEGTLRHVVRGA